MAPNTESGVFGPRRRPYLGTAVALLCPHGNAPGGDLFMRAPSAFGPRPNRHYEFDIGYLAVFLLVMGLLVGVGYHLYSTTRVSVAQIEWPDPFALGKTKVEKKLQAAVGDVSGPLAI